MSSYRRKGLVIGIVAVAALWFTVAFLPIAAQDATPGFATNTPQFTSAPQVFATNTPQLNTSLFAAPDTTVDRYALRLWDEASLIRVILNQVSQLRAGQLDRQMGIRLLQNEVRQRFPGAPHDPVLRSALLQAMLQAPLGSVDMRTVVRPTIEDALNKFKPSFEASGTFDFQGFTVTVTPANIDGRDGSGAVISIQYPSGDTLLYRDFVLASIDQNGVYHILPADYPAVPFNGLDALNLEKVGDLNGDGLDEVVVSVSHSGDANAELMIFGWRANNVVNLVVPSGHIQFRGIIQWDDQSHALSVQEYQVEAPAWQCLSARTVTWTWNLNFFRPPNQLDQFADQNSLGCLLYGAEPLFQKPLADAMNAVQQALPLATVDDQYASQRATLTEDMLEVFGGNLSQALDQVKQLQAAAQPGSWLQKQTDAFVQAASQSGVTPLQVCAALQNASPYGACDVNQVLMRIFSEQPLRRDQPIEAQVSSLGLNVLNQTTVSILNRVDRQAVHFDLAGDQWWGFAALKPDVYTAEEISTPPGFEPAHAPPLLVMTPHNAYDALLQDNNAAETLNILDNTIQSNPGVKLDNSIWFLQALSYDLLAHRSQARDAYFNLWASDPTSVWGQLAAAHLERR